MKILAKINCRLGQPFGNPAPMYTNLGLKGHNGLDYPFPTGTLLECVIRGKVEFVGEDSAAGKGVYIISDLGDSAWRTIYWHLQSFNVKVGDIVEVGDILGISDNTGMSTGPHLHFGLKPVKFNGTNYEDVNHDNNFRGAIDPFPYFTEVIYPPIKKGMMGCFVKQIQIYLNKVGYTLAVDEKFGKLTEQAVKDFQLKNGLKVDGIFGSLSMNKLLTYI